MKMPHVARCLPLLPIPGLWLPFLLSFVFSDVHAQSAPAPAGYDAWVHFRDHQPVLKGRLTALGDHMVTISPVRQPASTLEIPVDNIWSLRFRDKTAIKNGMVTGALIGFAAGFITGFVVAKNGDSESSGAIRPVGEGTSGAPVVGLGFGLIGAAGGAVCGGLAGSLKVKFALDGGQERYVQQKEALKKYLQF